MSDQHPCAKLGRRRVRATLKQRTAWEIMSGVNRMIYWRAQYGRTLIHSLFSPRLSLRLPLSGPIDLLKLRKD